MFEDKRVGELIDPDRPVVTINADAPVSQAAVLMRNNEVGCVVALNAQGDIAGILSERDIVRKVVASRGDPDKVGVREIMTGNVLAVTANTGLAKAEKVMGERGVRHLPVVRDGKLVGMLSARDILAQQLCTAQGLLMQNARIMKEVERFHPGSTKQDESALKRYVI